MPESFALVDVRQMNLDARLFDGGDGVAQRHRCVGVTTWVDQYTIEAFARFVYPIYQLTFVVTLSTSDANTQLVRQRFELSVHVRQSVFAIHLGLTQTKQVQVWSVQNEDVRQRSHPVRLSSSFPDCKRSRKRPLPILPLGFMASATKYSSLSRRITVTMFSA